MIWQPMNTGQGLEALRKLPPGTILSVGNFDGLHRGHQQILRVARRLADGGAGLAVVTFEPHPLTVIRPELAPPRLTTSPMKQQLLAGAGVDFLVVLPPEPAVLNLAAVDFWTILRDQVRPAHMVEGTSFTFGKNRGGNLDRLRQWSSGSSVRLHIVPAVEVVLLDLRIVQVSSSLIRLLLTHGRVRDAAICLGRPYVLEGPVVRGFGRGRRLGIPTANLYCGDQLVPQEGVYAARCTVQGRTYPAALSIGSLPTFGGGRAQVEAHLVSFEGDLYDQLLRVELVDWLREQVRYGNVEALSRQIHLDIQQTVDRVDCDPAKPLAWHVEPSVAL